MDQSQVARVVNGGQELQGRMKRGEAVAQSDRVGVSEGLVGRRRVDWEVARAADRVIRGRIRRNRQARATRRVSVVLDGNDGIEGVIGAAQEDEQDFFLLPIGSGQADAAFSQGAFDHERNVHQSGQGHPQTDFEAAVQEGAASEDIDVLHRLDRWAYCSWNRGEVMSMDTMPRGRES